MLAHYAEDLAKVMKKILCLCEVAALARDLRREADHFGTKGRSGMTWSTNIGMSKENFDGFIQETAKEFDDTDTYSFNSKLVNNSSVLDNKTNNEYEYLIDPNDLDKISGGLTPSQKMKLNELLGAW
jgi:hypothetical protein